MEDEDRNKISQPVYCFSRGQASMSPVVGPIGTRIWPIGFSLNIAIRHNRKLSLGDFLQMEKVWAITNLASRCKENKWCECVNVQQFLWFVTSAFPFLSFFFSEEYAPTENSHFKNDQKKKKNPNPKEDKWFLRQCWNITIHKSLAGPPNLGKSYFNILDRFWLT